MAEERGDHEPPDRRVHADRDIYIAGRDQYNITLPDPSDADPLSRAANKLAVAVQAQWKQAATQRRLAVPDPIRVTWGSRSRPLAGPIIAAIGSRRFAPLPGLPEAGEADLVSGRSTDHHALYGGLRSGRLVIAGPAGSGKSGAAVLLVLDALRHREAVSAEKRPQVPVPVLLTVQDWNPDDQPVAKWLTRKLRETYPLFRGSSGQRLRRISSPKAGLR